MDPNALALQSKAQLEATGTFVVEPDGRVRMTDPRGGYAPPWVWAPALTQDPTQRRTLSAPSSDPSSPWRSSTPYDSGGPFSNRSSWDSSKGTYEGGIDWPTLLGTIGVGGMFAAPALGAAFGPSAAGPMAGGETGMAATAAATAPPASLAAGGGSVGVGSVLGGLGKKAAGDVAGNVVNNVTGNQAPQGGGSKTAEMMALLGGLLAGQALKSHGANANVPPQLSQLMDLGTQRAVAQQPTFNAVNQGVFSMLPDFAKQGITPPSPMTFSPQQAQGDSGGGGMNPALIAALAGAGGVGLGGLLTGTNPYGAIVDGIKHLFGKGGQPSSTPSGPYQVMGPPDPNDPGFADWNVS